ncbi:CTCK domain-containing protein [Caenorhabditis elegans]|uniref:CTCK domain-containing protein n=1 Tax=Caenorhabditis elegans TaxID=6239 RepID=Q19769_CAEEL|nr:CTCK domain-containing protein [Caenorhabditis elegans]CAA94754.2 CTCK domain-containing protein [Caenorhabditis elegans]|eukprot:NP_505472.2 Uncharacterized protein CELE_F25B3.2 [Caenorhabditis elegans]
MVFATLLFNLFLLISADLDQGYGFQTGHISMNDSEITILINSTFEIIEDFDNETEISLSKSTESSETPSTTPLPPLNITEKSVKLPVRMKKLRPSTNVQCQKYTEAEKYKLLEDAGGRNQLFMADSVDEASQNFAESYTPNPLGNTLGDAVFVAHFQQTNPCDSRCQMIKAALNGEISRRSSSPSNNTTNPFVRVFGRLRASVFSDAHPTVPGNCALGNFIPVGTCSDLGETIDGGTHESLCSECRGLYMLGANCFPKIFNTVQCNSQEMGCIFDTFTDKAHGQCGIQTLSFKVLRNTGDDNCEDWIVEQIQLPVACQCSLSKSSFLRAKPSKEL